MEGASGIGGVFLRSSDPDRLRAWYEANLGIAISEWGGNAFIAEAGDATVWSIFPGETDYWPAEQQTMVNYASATSTRCWRSFALPAPRWTSGSRSRSSAASAGPSSPTEIASSSGSPLRPS